MQEYFVNIMMDLSRVIIISIVVYAFIAFAFRFLKKHTTLHSSVRDKAKTIVTFVYFMFVVLFSVLALVSGKSTYKHEPYNKQQKATQVQNSTEQSGGQVVDRSKQPSLSEQERSDRFDSLIDYKSRIQ